MKFALLLIDMNFTGQADLRHQGRSRSRLLRALDNEEDGVSSAFLKGKQNGIFYKFISHFLKSYENAPEFTKIHKKSST